VTLFIGLDESLRKDKMRRELESKLIIKIVGKAENDIIELANKDNKTTEQVIIDALSVYKALYEEVRNNHKRVFIKDSMSQSELIL
jgi:hypothetical protein